MPALLNARHDGIHAFHVGKNANVRYEEKHYGEGEGTGEKILNPVTEIELEEGAVFTLDTAQIRRWIPPCARPMYG